MEKLPRHVIPHHETPAQAGVSAPSTASRFFALYMSVRTYQTCRLGLSRARPPIVARYSIRTPKMGSEVDEVPAKPTSLVMQIILRRDLLTVSLISRLLSTTLGSSGRSMDGL
jgi:hypothetical protein